MTVKRVLGVIWLDMQLRSTPSMRLVTHVIILLLPPTLSLFLSTIFSLSLSLTLSLSPSLSHTLSLSVSLSISLAHMSIQAIKYPNINQQKAPLSTNEQYSFSPLEEDEDAAFLCRPLPNSRASRYAGVTSSVG